MVYGVLKKQGGSGKEPGYIYIKYIWTNQGKCS